MHNNVMRSEDEKKTYEIRLNRIEGQVKGIQRMIKENRHCADILVQVAAIDKALKALGQEMLLNHMKTCMVDDIKAGRLETIDEIMDLCRKLI